jgi:hypothetical protein
MALIVGQASTRPSKICIREAVEYEPMKWKPTGCSLYIDRDAPLDSLPGWKKALLTGECVINDTLFKQIRKIMEDSLKKLEPEEV